MLKNKSEKAFTCLRHRGFDGIRKDAVTVSKGASEIRNFRILRDGSLEKRCGFRTLNTFSRPLRGIWQGNIGAVDLFFVVYGSEVYTISPDGEVLLLCYHLNTSSGKVQFCPFQNTLLLLDGNSIYIWIITSDATGWFYMRPYPPLIGENWDSVFGGASLEPYNVLTPKRRIRYLFKSGDVYFYFPFKAASIDSLLIDGQRSSNFSFTPNTSRFALHDERAEPGSVIEILVTAVSSGFDPSPITSCKNGFFFHSGNLSTLFLSNGSTPCNVYYTTPVPDEHVKDCLKLGYDFDPIYIKKEQVFTVGDNLHPVNAFCQNYDRVLAFSSIDTWSIRITENGPDVSAYPVLSGIGCTSLGGAFNIVNDIYVLSANGINRLSSSNQDPDLLSVTPISRDIPELSGQLALSDAFFCLHFPQRELWVRDPNDLHGLVWIWNLENQKWYCFDNFFADAFLETPYGLYFTAGNHLNLLDESTNTDAGSPISASYTGDYLDFGSPEAVKRSLRASLTAHTGNDYVRLELDNGTVSDSIRVHGKVTLSPSTIDRRVHLGRFRSVRYRISSSGTDRSRFYELLLSANL